MRALPLLPLCLALLAGCPGFRGPSEDRSDHADRGHHADRDDRDHPDEAGGQQHGPGPWGALPTGYCCTSDLDCRYRRCVAVGEGKMCADRCFGASMCEGGLQGFRCVTDDGGYGGTCRPEQGDARCVPAEAFTRGTKKLGDCCVATHDGRAGQECEGNHCGSFTPSGKPYTNPYICTNVCTKPADCPGNYVCSSTSDGHSVCVRTDEVYTCR